MIAGTGPDFDIPANACVIAGSRFGCTCFDVNSACSSFVVGLNVARSMMLSGQLRVRLCFRSSATLCVSTT